MIGRSTADAILADAEHYANLGMAALKSKRPDQALALFSKVVALVPQDLHSHIHLATALILLGDYEAAVEQSRRAIAIDSSNPQAWATLGAAYLKQEKYAEAILALVKAIELHPGDYFHAPMQNLGLALVDFRKFREAHTVYEQIYQTRPEDIHALIQLIHSSLHICQWTALDSQIDTLRRAIAAGVRCDVPPFIFLAIPGLSGRDHLGLSAAYADYRLTTAEPADFPAVSGSVRRRLRIGYLSADYREHPTSQLIAGVFEHHDRERFHVIGYSYGGNDGSPMRLRIENALGTFHDIRDLPHEQSAQRIRDDELDILIDLKGWTGEVRMEIPALRPAPVLVSWLGYPGSLGDRRLADYIIGDPVVTPLEHAADYSEILALMPHSYQPNDDKRLIGPNPGRAVLGLPENGFVFCAFCQGYKINPAVFDLWCRLLAAIEGSVLWLLDPGEVAVENLRREATSRGIAAERLVFAPHIALSAHLCRLQSADLALDTFPYGSHTTGSDALWAGVPLVAYCGDIFASRVSTSLVTAAGLSELSASSPDQYFQLAFRLASRPHDLASIRRRLADNRLTCPLFDTTSFTRDLEALYMAIIDDHRAGLRRPIQLKAVERA